MHRSTGEDGPMVIAGSTAEDGPMVIADNIGVDSGDTAIMSSWSMNCKHYRLAISEALRYPTRVFFSCPNIKCDIKSNPKYCGKHPSLQF